MTTADKIFVLCIAVLLVVWAVWPRKNKSVEPATFEYTGTPLTPESTGKTEHSVPVDCTLTGDGAVCHPTETAAQRYLRLQNEWRTANDAAHEEQTPLKQKADDLFRQYMDAERALTKENKR